ncbi:MAG: protein kinase [Ktedonobacteraceae bacterium]
MQPEDLVGQALGHYQIKRQVGYGGMATVFLAEDIHLNREVALKVFWPRPGETQDFLRRFGREARVLAQLDHPHILPVYDYGEQGEMAYLVTPYLSGGTLKELLQERKVLPPSEAIKLLAQILPALQYAHERNLIHRDIKPANLLFKADGTLVLADFGLVKVTESEDKTNAPLHTLTQSGQMIAGTPEYMAPEQIEGNAVPASDIYSLGIVLYEMVTGVRPFVGSTLMSILMKHMQEPPQPPHLHNRYITPQLEAVILRSLEKEPSKRFARPADFQQALAQITNRVSNPASNPGIVNPPAGSSNPDQSRMAATAPGEFGPTIGTNWEQMPGSGQRPAAMPSTTSGFQNARTANQPPTVFSAQQSGRGPITPFQPVQPWNQPANVSPTLTIPPRVVQKSSRTPVVLLLLLLVLLAGLVTSLFLTPLGASLFHSHNPGVAATASGVPTSNTNTITPVVGGGSPSAPGNATQPMPTTQTTCPGTGTARAAITAHLVLGQHPTIVYIVNEHNAGGAPTFGTVKTRDIVTNGKKELTKTNTTIVDEAQVSNDGEWVLFAATIGGQSQLRLVRLDGQGLQTLLCAPAGMTIRNSQWSLDQKNVIFDEIPQVGGPKVYLLNMQTGMLQVEVNAPSAGISLISRVWLDANRVLMIGFVPNSDAPPQNIYVLDIRNGANQNIASLQKIFNSAGSTCWDFDSSFDAHTLFITQCTPSQPNGSSTIVSQPTSGGPSTPVLSSSILALNTVRVIDPHNASLLALSSDTGLGNPNGDPAHDGLYLVKTNGSAPQRLTSTPAGQSSNLNSFSQYFWSNVSRDGSLYVLQTTLPGTNFTYTLSYGPLNGGASTTFASITGTTLEIAGWTTT